MSKRHRFEIDRRRESVLTEIRDCRRRTTPNRELVSSVSVRSGRWIDSTVRSQFAPKVLHFVVLRRTDSTVENESVDEKQSPGKIVQHSTRLAEIRSDSHFRGELSTNRWSSRNHHTLEQTDRQTDIHRTDRPSTRAQGSSQTEVSNCPAETSIDETFLRRFSREK